MYRFLVIIEQGETSYGAYAPDLPGCVAVGDTREEVEQNMREAMAMHLQSMIDDQEPIPPATSTAQDLEVSLPNTVA